MKDYSTSGAAVPTDCLNSQRNHILISVVVPTFDRPQLLRRCLESLIIQTMDPSSFEIIVVADGPSKATEQIVAKLRDKTSAPDLRYLESPAHRGPAAARNLGWKSARGAIIAFTDDDCIAQPTWLEAGWAELENRRVSGLWGRIVVPIPTQPTDHEWNTKQLEKSPGATANCFYRKTALEAVGGFDERFTAAWREDSDLQFMLLERGHRMMPCRQAVVFHPARPAPWGISLRQQRNNIYNALLYKKHPSLYRSQIQQQPPWRYYVTVTALMLTAAAIITQWTPGIWFGLVLWLGMTAWFCAQRLRATSHGPSHVLEMAVTSALIPPLAVFWRLQGAWRFRVAFL
jgi:glycosyltransferase involved in cell wall biosynthesis